VRGVCSIGLSRVHARVQSGVTRCECIRSTKFNYPEIVELLLRAGARTDMITRDEKTARDLAVWGRDRSHEQMGDILALFDKYDVECRAQAAAAGQSSLPGAPLRRLAERTNTHANLPASASLGAHCASQLGAGGTGGAGAASGDALDHWILTRAAPCAAPAMPPPPGPMRHQDHSAPACSHGLAHGTTCDAHAQSCRGTGGIVCALSATAGERISTGGPRVGSALRHNHRGAATSTVDMLGGRWQKTLNTRPW
jgi:hypothetical protein